MSEPRPLFVGEAPGPSTDGRPGAAPLVGMTGHRLAAWAGLSPAQFRSRAVLVNLFHRLPERWKQDDARAAALAVAAARRGVGGGAAVLLGRRVADAFEHRGEPFAWDEAGGVRWAMMPHPSGLNHYWNDPANVRRAERFLRRLLGVAGPRARQVRLPMRTRT